MLKVAIVGCGGISHSHETSWAQIPEAKLVAVCDIREEKRQVLMDKYGCPGYEDYKKMLRKEKPDILDICLPTYLHPDVAVYALKHGCHVLTEKPISLKKKDVKRVYAAAAANDRRFMVAQVLRFWREYMFVADVYRTGKYGKLLSGSMIRQGNRPRSSWDDWMCDPERSGLVPFDLHIHDLDFIVATFGKPDHVTCDRARTEKQDYIHAVYHFPDFFIATEAAWYDCDYHFMSSFRFQFERAVLESKDGVLTVFPSEGGSFRLDEEHSGEDLGYELPHTNAYFNEIRYFTDCVLQGVDCDRVKADELETVLDYIKKLDR